MLLLTAPAQPLMLAAPAQPLMLSAWSVTTTEYEKHQYRNSKPYTDTPRSWWEAARVIKSKKVVA